MIGRRPGRLRAEWEQRAGQAADEVGFGTCGGEGETDTRCGFDDAGGDFQEAKARSVANSAVANSRALGMASRTVSISQ